MLWKSDYCYNFEIRSFQTLASWPGGTDMAVIVIDPGHGGSATIQGDSTWNNAVGPQGTLEKNLTLDIGLKVKALLAAAGHDATATRTTDVNLRLRDRAKVAKTRKADAFVSIHFNGSTNHDAQGTETLVGLNHTSRSARLSLAVQDALLPVTGLRDRNKSFDAATRIKPQALGVLKLADHDPETAACLAEISFLDRADEEERLRDERYRDAIAKAIADGVTAYLATATRSRGKAASFGDAIESEAGTTSSARIEQFLSLDSVATVRARGAVPGEAGERSAPPRNPFPRAFVRGARGRFAIAPAALGWTEKDDFVAFIGELGLTHFHPDEFLELGASNNAGTCKGLNAFPPRELWPRIANTALMLDRIRAEMGASIRITSCYRSPAYNACVKGEPNSLHSQFNAIDFTCLAGTPEIWRRIAARLRSEDPRFTGGIGVYPKQNFVHIDTRGSVADWSGP
ncbi:N-acetylmuramoyl-L-alanine amidase [Roseomonas sp. CAU 1739]|uniref:N-acetylmuramoyl-L-alanine amidase n=1 Tax=Roseomonas sp. CAU 1739 TaxID=3140364 RepID=UPI00325B035D